MARKKIIYTHEHPYHVMARSNNKDWFYLPTQTCWNIFSKALKRTQEKYELTVYIFVLMDNHYHMLCQCSEKHNLGDAMNYFQKTVSKEVNKHASRINHVFGGPYKGCLIRTPLHFSKVYKYVARNPITAGISADVFKYPFSTLSNNNQIKITCDNEWFVEMNDNYFADLNQSFEVDDYLAINKSLKKTEFKIKSRASRKSL